MANVGERAAAEVVQLYIQGHSSEVRRPAKELRGFVKVWLEPRTSQTLTFTLGPAALAFYDTGSGEWRTPEGAYSILVGFSSRDIQAQTTVRVVKDG